MKLSDYLHRTWPRIRARGFFNLAVPFPAGTRAAAINVHLYFVKVFGCKLHADHAAIDLAPFSRALLSGRPHPEIGLNIAHSPVGDGKILAYDSEVHTMRNQAGVFDGLIWLYLVHPVAVKVSYISSTVLKTLLLHDIVPRSSITARGLWWQRAWNVDSRSTGK
jgi:hypothetical protein